MPTVHGAALRPSLPGQPRFLPMNMAEMHAAGWDALDILLVSGDAYVDHPSFGTALLGRWLVAHGFRVGVVAQPAWQGPQELAAGIAALQAMGRPRLFAGVTAGAIDSMLAHYTAFRKKRHDDAYTPGGGCGARPNRACMVYTNMVRQAFPHLPVVLGGIEASLRRLVHYDFWEDSLRRPLLLDSKADLTVYGMGETALLAIARHAQDLLEGQTKESASFTASATNKISEITQTENNAAPAAPIAHANLRKALVAACAHVPGVAYVIAAKEEPALQAAFASNEVATSFLPSYENIIATPADLMAATMAVEAQVHTGGTALLQRVGDRTLACTPPQPPLEEQAMDALYALPYSRLPHPAYTAPIPAWEMIRTSITTHRGCGGGCSFCSLALHQGRRIASRSKKSILAEAETIAKGPDTGEKTPRWAGSISDVGGPSANMWQATCTLPKGTCHRESCMHPSVCRFFKVDQTAGVALLRAVQATPGVRHVRVASGVRFDLALQNSAALAAYTAEFTGGQLKVAPEHSEDAVLDLMRKPGLAQFEAFLSAFNTASCGAAKEQYTVPYLMSAFPGCTLEHMLRLGRWLRQKNWSPQQVQCFIPTPGTVATAMFYAGVDTRMRPLPVARTDKQRLEQHHALLGSEGHSPRQHRPGKPAAPRRNNERQKGKPGQPGQHENGNKSATSRKNTARDNSRHPAKGQERHGHAGQGYAGQGSRITDRQKPANPSQESHKKNTHNTNTVKGRPNKGRG